MYKIIAAILILSIVRHVKKKRRGEKIMFSRKVVLITVIIFLTSCNSESRLYKRVGGEHLHLKSNDKELFWFNGIHGHDPKNPMFNDIKTEFQQYKPDLVLVEGHADANSHKDEVSAIKSGENHYVSFLAKKNGIECYDIEPTDAKVNIFLLDKYSKKDVLTMYLIRQMVQWKRKRKNEIDFEKQVVDYLSWEDENIGYFNQEITLERVSELLKPHTNLDHINNANWTDFKAKEYIYFSENRINTIYNDISSFRNKHLLFVINKKLKDYDKIFIMMGFDHAEEIKKELLEIFETK